MPFVTIAQKSGLSARSLLFAALFCATAAQAQTAADSTAASALPDDTRAIVNGQAITDTQIDNVAEQIIASGQAADRDNILDELINLEVLSQAALDMGLDQQAEVAASLKLQFTQTLANAYLAQQGADMQFSDEELRAEYDAQSANVDTAEYRASHILLDSADQAQAVIDALAEGEAFDELAAERSIDPSGATGGDLGWFQAATIGPALAEAVADMEVGETSDSPIQTDYGYHVLQLTDRRQAALPDFESVRSGLSSLAVRKALARHVEELRSAADVEKLP